MYEPIFDPGRLFRAFHAGKGATVEDEGCRVHTLPFESAHTAFLRPGDRGIEENRRFSYLMIDPVLPARRTYADVVLLTHGLNEGSYAKLFPWAYNLTRRLRVPVLVFPMAFHINRRSGAWAFTPQVHLADARARMPGNRKTSPFNARISARLSEAPERYYRGGLQTYYDVIDLSDRIRAGTHPGCRPGTRIHFLGYSAGGYVALILRLADPGGRFTHSKCVLFASGAPLDAIHPASIFITDSEGEGRLLEFLGTRAYEREAFDPAMAVRAEEPARWLTEILFHGAALEPRLRALRSSLHAVAGVDDIVITAAGMARNLHPLEVQRLELGIHEFPFTMAGPLPGAYNRRQAATRDLIRNVKRSHIIAPAYRAAFSAFMDGVASFFRLSS